VSIKRLEFQVSNSVDRRSSQNFKNFPSQTVTAAEEPTPSSPPTQIQQIEPGPSPHTGPNLAETQSGRNEPERPRPKTNPKNPNC
jgi:hypothetical protein